jgi:hypothetical protein
MVQESNPDVDEILHPLPDLPWGPPTLLYNGYWGSFPGVNCKLKFNYNIHVYTLVILPTFTISA